MVAGPSEVLVIADGSADPRWVAADMLAQAEHDELASALCLTPTLAWPKSCSARLPSACGGCRAPSCRRHP